jgi:FtsP/CotA-like multicopper oxidase with cupredoxin domain
MHLHRHLWELAEINGKKTTGVVKDTVVVPYYGRAVVDFTADQPGLALFHCHMQQHMDYGFKALFRYDTAGTAINAPATASHRRERYKAERE